MEKPSHEDRITRTRAIENLLDIWGIDAADRMGLLALPEGTRAGAIRQVRRSTPFPDDARVLQRIGHLIGIADAVRTPYPHNARMGAIRMKQANYLFHNRTPLATMLEDGLDGIIAVRTYLDCA